MRRRSGLVITGTALAIAANAAIAEGIRIAPNCSLAPLGEGPAWELRELRGKVLWVDFWASWCAPCAEALPFLDQLDRELPDRDFEIVGINVDENASDAQEFLARHPVGFRLAVDASGRCPREFDVPGMPAAFLIDRGGAIRYVHLGFRPGDAPRIRARVQSLLAEEPGVAPVGELPPGGERHDAHR
jgi:thiol-disulfide isomerase/thioredoxin